MIVMDEYGNYSSVPRKGDTIFEAAGEICLVLSEPTFCYEYETNKSTYTFQVCREGNLEHRCMIAPGLGISDSPASQWPMRFRFGYL